MFETSEQSGCPYTQVEVGSTRCVYVCTQGLYVHRCGCVLVRLCGTVCIHPCRPGVKGDFILLSWVGRPTDNSPKFSHYSHVSTPDSGPRVFPESFPVENRRNVCVFGDERNGAYVN